MEKIQIKIAKSLLTNLLLSLLITFIALIIILQLGNYYIDNNPLSQFGPIYKDNNIGASMELGRMITNANDYPDKGEIFLLQLKIILNGNYDVNISYLIFGVCLSMIYAIKYIKIKLV